MPLKPFALTLALLALAPHAATLAADSLSRPSARLAGVAEQYYEAKARFYPLSATYSGDNRFDDQLAINIAPAEVKKRFSPGQALGYKIGSLKIVELRAPRACWARSSGSPSFTMRCWATATCRSGCWKRRSTAGSRSR